MISTSARSLPFSTGPIEMDEPYAEVIGDPIAQSKSPLIHRHWLDALGISGDYRATLVRPQELEEYLRGRRSDPHWLGCNVTMPHKERILAHLDALDDSAESVGAVNCVIPSGGRLVGLNTDLDGVAAALDPIDLEGEKTVVIGAGGGARAAVAYLGKRNVGAIALLLRDPKKGDALRGLAGDSRFESHAFEACEAAIEGASLIVNASPLGMAGSPDMPAAMIESIGRDPAGATLFDMVYRPEKTRFLAVGQENGVTTVDGLTMLIGQARRAFQLFFGSSPPVDDSAIRGLLGT